MRIFWNIIYYAFARFLPKSTWPIIGKVGQYLRNWCAVTIH